MTRIVFIILLLATQSICSPVQKPQKNKHTAIKKLLAIDTATMVRFKNEWLRLFDTSHLQPTLESNFEDANNRQLDDDLFYNNNHQMNSFIGNRRSLLVPLQPYLTLGDIRTTLNKSNAYRIQIRG